MQRSIVRLTVQELYTTASGYNSTQYGHLCTPPRACEKHSHNLASGVASMTSDLESVLTRLAGRAGEGVAMGDSLITIAPPRRRFCESEVSRTMSD